MRYEILLILKQGSGTIVNTVSAEDVVGFPGQAAYIACKHAVLGLTKTAAIDYAAKGIRINAVCPGVIQTAIVDELISCNPQLESAFTKEIPNGRFGKPEEIADAVLWLCSPQATYMNGHGLIVDGGITIK